MSDVKITVPFFGMTESEVDTGGTFTSISFDTIRKLIAPVLDLDEDEKITGLVIDRDGIKIKIN